MIITPPSGAKTTTQQVEVWTATDLGLQVYLRTKGSDHVTTKTFKNIQVRRWRRMGAKVRPAMCVRRNRPWERATGAAGCRPSATSPFGPAGSGMKPKNSKVKSPRQLLDLYYASAGRGASFLLNVPPDRRGRIHEADGESLREFGRLLHQTFASNLAVGAAIEASNQRGHDPAFAPAHLLDGSRRTYWATDDGLPTSTVTVRFRQPTTFDLVRLREYIQLGQRVDSFELETRQGSEWTPFGRGTSVGIGRVIKSEKPVVADALRLRLTSEKACPALSELSVHREA